MDLTDTARCLRPPPGWSCSREADHEGPCAASPDDVRSAPPVGARLAGRGAAADLDSIETQPARPLPAAIDQLEGSIGRLDAEVQGLIEELGPIIGGGAEGDTFTDAEVLPDGSSPLRDRVLIMRGNVEGIRNHVAELRGRMEV